MFDRLTAAFGARKNTVNYGNLPDSVRDEILDAMTATSKTDIR